MVRTGIGAPEEEGGWSEDAASKIGNREITARAITAREALALDGKHGDDRQAFGQGIIGAIVEVGDIKGQDALEFVLDLPVRDYTHILVQAVNISGAVRSPDTDPKSNATGQ